jgi:hypothetical protein
MARCKIALVRPADSNCDSGNLPIANASSPSTGCFGTTRLYGAGEMVKKDGALFGPPKSEYNFPKTMNTRDRMSGTGEFKYTDARKETVPNKNERPILGITTTKNFITANAVEAILQGE